MCSDYEISFVLKDGENVRLARLMITREKQILTRAIVACEQSSERAQEARSQARAIGIQKENWRQQHLQMVRLCSLVSDKDDKP